MDGVISAFHTEPTKLRLHTTRSWDFINLLEGIGNSSSSNAEELLHNANYGKDIVVGVLDTGGFASGTATESVPLVRLAMYNVCWPVPGYSLAEGNACLNDDILAAFDDAIKDGVRVISVSIGPSTSRQYKEDGIAIGETRYCSSMQCRQFGPFLVFRQ
ncbi:unnamed protein product [Fraxinus pennsylvanica]|uniref:Uncharacterized protein n=1 Tax=Fraxinus pennsylvanica TaxID=56036 RepID=A0AAD2EDL2_9LAMI|nr:unnamed protein product [Fraxinus pennsylvanica]